MWIGEEYTFYFDSFAFSCIVHNFYFSAGGSGLKNNIWIIVVWHEPIKFYFSLFEKVFSDIEVCRNEKIVESNEIFTMAYRIAEDTLYSWILLLQIISTLL